MSRKPSVPDIDIMQAAQNHSNMLTAAKAVGLNMTSFVYRAKRLGVYNPNQQDPTNRVTPPSDVNRYVLQEILDGKHPHYGTNDLKKRLIKAGIKTECCEICGLVDSGLVFHLDHLDGDSTNHTLHNLRILCPNCHSKTPTFAGKNKKTRGQVTPDTVMLDLILDGLDNTRLLQHLQLTPNGANCRRVNKLRYIVEHITGRLTE